MELQFKAHSLLLPPPSLGTYGGHLELSAFASLKRKEIKIVQPGLVYVVTGHDDSNEAIADREALEAKRQVIQSRHPPGSEVPPLSARHVRQQKRFNNVRAKSKEPLTELLSCSSPVAGSSRMASMEQDGSSDNASSSKDTTPQDGPVEAFGPLYIAYHNYEHYSSVRNLAGPHTGLPRIVERNVSLAAAAHQQQPQPSAASPSKLRSVAMVADRDDDDDDDLTDLEDEFAARYSQMKPTEHEELILRSVPGHSLAEVRLLLKLHGNLWEQVVEVLIAQDAAAAKANGGILPAAGGAGSPPASMTTRSRHGSSSYLGSPHPNSPSLSSAPKRLSSNALPTPNSPGKRPLPAVPDYLRTKDAHSWRSGEPSPALSSPSSDQAKDDPLSEVKSQTVDQAIEQLRAAGSDGSGSSSSGPDRSAMRKRAASKDATLLRGEDQDGRLLKRRSRSTSTEREMREEQIVDGVLSSETVTYDRANGNYAVKVEYDNPRRTVSRPDGDATNASTPLSSAEGATGSLDSPASPYNSSPRPAKNTSPSKPARNVSSSVSRSSSTVSSDPLQPLFVPASSYATRNRILSPPLSPTLMAQYAEANGGLSAKEKRELDLKRKRDRQRERRAGARKGAPTGSGTGFGGKGHKKKQQQQHKKPHPVAAATSTTSSNDPSAAEVARKREIRREREGGSGGSTEAGEFPKGFVELKI